MRMRSEIGIFLNSIGLVGIGVEIGVFRGDFSQQILQAWTGKSLILLDPWRHLVEYLDSWNLSDEEMEENFKITVTKLTPYKGRVKILRMRSEEAVRAIDDASCDFAYLDANHSYHATNRDLKLWFPKLRAGGLMCGHDYFDAIADDQLEPILGTPTVSLPKERLTSYGVKSAVDEFAQRINAKIRVTEEKFPTWYFRKGENSGYDYRACREARAYDGRQPLPDRAS
jgi:hypothetical protein